MTAFALAELELATEDDLFVARQLGLQCASGLGMDHLDALRLATAIGEIGREAIASGEGRLTLEVASSGRLEVTVSAAAVSPQWATALAGAARLVDDVTAPTTAALGAAARLEKELSGPAPDVAELETLRGRLLEARRVSVTDELRRQNRDLIAALEQAQAQRSELQAMNHELEETNRGVMALYSELASEMERTNQGVVALYAEIEDKNLQLREASEAKSRFLRSISHELRTPVNSVLGLTGLLLDPRQLQPLSAEHTEQVQYIRTSAHDLQRLVEELLDLAKAESGRLDAVMGEVSLPDLFADLRAVIEPTLRPGVVLRVELSGATTMTTDVDLLRHVLRNLLSNAAKFTDAGEVVLWAAVEGDEVELGVRDTGVGIASGDLDRIFEEFYQASSPLHATSKGTGLGLPFAQLVANALGGRIELESRLGEGSSFRLRLPIGGLPVGAQEVEHA